MKVANRRAHLLVGADVLRQAAGEAGGIDAQRGGEPPLEGRDVDLPGFEVDQRLAGLRVLPERALGIAALAGAERVEGGEHARGQHAAPVDQERL